MPPTIGVAVPRHAPRGVRREQRIGPSRENVAATPMTGLWVSQGLSCAGIVREVNLRAVLEQTRENRRDMAPRTGIVIKSRRPGPCRLQCDPASVQTPADRRRVAEAVGVEHDVQGPGDVEPYPGPPSNATIGVRAGTLGSERAITRKRTESGSPSSGRSQNSGTSIVPHRSSDPFAHGSIRTVGAEAPPAETGATDTATRNTTTSETPRSANPHAPYRAAPWSHAKHTLLTQDLRRVDPTVERQPVASTTTSTASTPPQASRAASTTSAARS
jgi:hypothetical protein